MSESPRGLLALVQDFFNERLPKGVNWPQTLGSSLLALVAVQIATGILLSLYYSPNAETAYESVQFIERHVLFGRLIRGVHYFAASGMVILVFLHVLRTFFFGSYKRPRQWTWVVGVLLLLVVLGFAFTGYLLPWDMKAYFATRVGINIAGVVPVIGKYVVRILQGGSEMSTITLSRFFSLHVVVLPLILVLLLLAHLYYIRLHGITPPGKRVDEPAEYGERFYPAQLFRDSLVAFGVVAVIFLLAARYGAPLEAKANPNDTTYVPRPDWYFYSLFQLLKLFPGRLEVIGAVILPGAFFTLLLLLPFLDRNPERRLSKRPVARAAGVATVALIVVLTAWGAYEGRKAKAAMAVVTGEPSEKPDTELGNPDAGEELFAELKCGVCHRSLSQDENIPPGLEFAGNKFQPGWLVAYLREPYRIRWREKNQRPKVRMPNFNLTQQEARDLAAFLLNNRQDFRFPQPAFDWDEADAEMIESGRELFAEYGCFGCHRIGNEGQNIGPDLTHVGSKLLEAYLFHLIKAPDQVIPGTSMKNFQLDDEEVEDIVAYLRTLK